MSKKRNFRNVRTISDVAVNSIVRFPKRSGLYKVVSINDGIVFLEKIERKPQISFVSPLCTVYLVEGF